MKALLQRGDGWKQRPYLRSVVMTAQEAINYLDFHAGLKVDGHFGPSLERTLKAFQQERGLVPNGIIGKATWKAMAPVPVNYPQLPYFRGDLRWVHLQEAHAGRPYWPGKASGVTIDPGIDLGHADVGLIRELLDEHYSSEVWADQQVELVRAIGKRGIDARDHLKSHALLGSIRISRSLANEVMPWASAPYWRAISRRFPLDRGGDCPASVQTALLSLAYNRGSNNRHLETLRGPLEGGNWLEVAQIIGRMQQARGDGIPQRRRDERDIIVAELELEQS